jgi:hypothetical protein
MVAAVSAALLTMGCASTSARQGTVTLPATAGAPPAVLQGAGTLFCNISDRQNGRQTLQLAEGGGLEFDAVVSPIVDGVVEADGPDKGGVYRFTSHLAAPAKGQMVGIGPVDIEALETKVAVRMDRYQQRGGPGTELTFTSEQMSRRGIYIEFVGQVRAKNGDRFGFRVNLGAPTRGSGRVKPQTASRHSNVTAKVVNIEAPMNTVLVKIATRVERLQ